MILWIVISNYFNNMYFGAYSNVLNARKAIDNFVAADDNIVACEDTGNYGYQLTLANGENRWIEIVYDVLDTDDYAEGDK